MSFFFKPVFEHRAGREATPTNRRGRQKDWCTTLQLCEILLCCPSFSISAWRANEGSQSGIVLYFMILPFSESVIAQAAGVVSERREVVDVSVPYIKGRIVRGGLHKSYGDTFPLNRGPFVCERVRVPKENVTTQREGRPLSMRDDTAVTGRKTFAGSLSQGGPQLGRPSAREGTSEVPAERSVLWSLSSGRRSLL